MISSDEKYTGEWTVEPGQEPEGLVGDNGLVIQNKARHHGIIAPFARPLDVTDKELVVQYEVRLQHGLECGGAYLKLLTASADGPTTIGADTPYTIMFGPDKCGHENKLHFIFRHENPVSHEIEEKHVDPRPSIKSDSLSHLYTLHVKPDNSFEIFIDQQSVKKGSLLEDFKPAVNPPKEIDDPTDSKPADWVDEKMIPDPDEKKPDDWDETQPAQIPDPAAVKPEGWLDDAPDSVPDPEAVKPADWDDEVDGEWEAPMVDNPACDEVGCGEWKAPMVRNPLYKGKWSAPLIENPAYRGEWKARQIPNPNYFEDLHPHNFKPMGAVGFELWTMSDKIAFDNILITHSKDVADRYAADTWAKKFEAQDAHEKARAAEERAKTKGPSSDESWFDTASRLYDALMLYAADKPEVVFFTGLVGATVPFLLLFLFTRSPSDRRPARPTSADSDSSADAADASADAATAEPPAATPVSEDLAAKAEDEERVKDEPQPGTKSPRRSTRAGNRLKKSTD